MTITVLNLYLLPLSKGTIPTWTAANLTVTGKAHPQQWGLPKATGNSRPKTSQPQTRSYHAHTCSVVHLCRLGAVGWLWCLDGSARLRKRRSVLVSARETCRQEQILSPGLFICPSPWNQHLPSIPSPVGKSLSPPFARSRPSEVQPGSLLFILSKNICHDCLPGQQLTKSEIAPHSLIIFFSGVPRTLRTEQNMLLLLLIQYVAR